MVESGEKICPFCFTVFAPGVLDDDYPFCRECSNFGRSIFVEPSEDFFTHATSVELQTVLDSWLHREKFLEAEKSMITTNLQKIIGIVKTQHTK